MKRKCLVLFALGAGLSWGAETAPFGSVVGGVASGTASGCYDGSGYLDITTAGRKEPR